MRLPSEPDKVKRAEERATQSAREKELLSEVEQLRKKLNEAQNQIRQLEAQRPEAKIIVRWKKAQRDALGKSEKEKYKIAIDFAKETKMIKIIK